MATENLSRIASDFETQISTAGIAVGDSSFKVLSVVDADGNTLSDGIYCFTIDRDSADSKEYLIGQLTTATKTISSLSSVSRQGVLTANAQRSHRIGANVIISDHSILAALSRIFTGQGTINPAAPLAYTTAPTLSSATEIATKGYVDSVVTGGTVNTDRIILGSQTAGETVAAGNIVYFKSSDSRWWLADANLTATFSNVQLGVALGSGTAGNSITGGVQIYGKCDSFTSLTATATYYLSDTAGAVSTSSGTNTVILGQAFSTTGIFFNPDSIASTISQVPTGSITMYASSSAPTGYLNCDGSAVSRTTYANLFAVVSTAYGVGDGSSTFNLPDLKARFPLGYASSAPTKVFTFASRSSDTITVTSDVLTNSTTNELQTGQKVRYVTTSSAITGLTNNTDYYLIRVAYNQFKLATTIQNANKATAISLSSDGSGTQTFTVTYSARAIADKGGVEVQATVPVHNHSSYYINSNNVKVQYGSNEDYGTTDTGDAGESEPNNMPPFTVVNYIIKI